MAKYSYEFKQQVVNEYLKGEGGYRFLARKYNIPDKSSVAQWVASYNAYGKKGLLPAEKNENYSFDFKCHVVELYLTTKVTYQDLALSVGILHPSMIARWVKGYKDTGPDALRAGRKDWVKAMSKQQNKKKPSKKDELISPERLKELEDENLNLRIENAYLKELRRLRLEGKSPLKKKRESSTVSEESSN